MSEIGIMACKCTDRLASEIASKSADLAYERCKKYSKLINPDENLDLINCSIITIEGCKEGCLSSVMAKKKNFKNLHSQIYIPEILAKSRINLRGEKRNQLGKAGSELVQEVADVTKKHVDEIANDTKVVNGYSLYVTEKLKIRENLINEVGNVINKKENEKLFRISQDIMGVFHDCGVQVVPPSCLNIHDLLMDSFACLAYAVEALGNGNDSKYKKLFLQSNGEIVIVKSWLKKKGN